MPQILRPPPSALRQATSSVVLFAVLIGGTEGCALTNLNVSPPPPGLLAQPRSLGRGREVAVVMPFADDRPMQDRCGMKKNGYNMDTASVYCTMQPNKWMTQALTQGLYSAGFRVRTAAHPSTEAPVTIEGNLLQFFVEPKVGFLTYSTEADISVKLVVTSRNGLRAERVFYLKGYPNPGFLAMEGDFEEASDNGTRRAVTAMVYAIASLLDGYPEIGSKAPTPSSVISEIFHESAKGEPVLATRARQ